MHPNIYIDICRMGLLYSVAVPKELQLTRVYQTSICWCSAALKYKVKACQ